MYSYEITQLLESNGYNIDSESYINMINSSPQIDHLIYKSFDNCFEMWDENGDYWRYNVQRK